MTVVVHNSEVGTGTGADPSVYTLGFTPTAGRSLLVWVRSFNPPVSTVSDDGGNSWVQDLDWTNNADTQFWRVQTIGTPPTTITIDHAGTVFTFVAVLEVSGLAASPVTNTVDDVLLVNGTTHSQSYTTTVDGSLVFGSFEASGTTEWNGVSGTTGLIIDTSEARGAFYKVVPTAETGDVNLTSLASKAPRVGHVVYEPTAASGATITGSGTPAAQASATAGTSERELPGSGTPASAVSTASGTGERELTGSGTPTSQAAATAATAERTLVCSGVLLAGASTVAGTASLALKLTLTAAAGRELRDENGVLVANLANIAYEWYDKDTDTEGNPNQAGTFSTNASGEATIQLTTTSLTVGQFGLLILEHPTDSAIRGIYRIPVA